jgi:GNAT superfamily N-acetyltransferase
MYSTQSADSLLHMLEVRPLTVDDLSAARYVMSSAFLAAAKDYYRETEIAAYVDYVRSPLYADLLLGNRSFAAWVGSEMVGVGAWSGGEDESPTARILAIFVRPLFAGEGIASRLIEFLEVDAHNAGYRSIEASVTLNAVELFVHHGYDEVGSSVLRLPAAGEMPVARVWKDSANPEVMH